MLKQGRRKLITDYLRQYSEKALQESTASVPETNLKQYESYQLLKKLQLDGPYNRKSGFKHRPRRIHMNESKYKKNEPGIDDKFDEVNHISFDQNLNPELGRTNPNLVLSPWGVNSRTFRKEQNKWHLGTNSIQFYFKYLLEHYIRDQGKFDLRQKGRYLNFLYNFHMTHQALSQYHVNPTTPKFPALYVRDQMRKLPQQPSRQQIEQTLSQFNTFKKDKDTLIEQINLGENFTKIKDNMDRVGRDLIREEVGIQRFMLIQGRVSALQKAIFLHYIENNIQKNTGMLNTIITRSVPMHNYLYSAKFVAHRMAQMVTEFTNPNRIIAQIFGDIQTEMNSRGIIGGCVLIMLGNLKYQSPSERQYAIKHLGDTREFEHNTHSQMVDFALEEIVMPMGKISVKCWIQYNDMGMLSLLRSQNRPRFADPIAKQKEAFQNF